MRTFHILIIALVVGFAGRAGADFEEVDPATGVISLSSESVNGEAERYWRELQRYEGNEYICELGYWERDTFYANVQFCWAIDLGGWHRDYTASKYMLEQFSVTEDVDDWSDGPRLDSAIGDISTIRFDVENMPAGQSGQCIGFRQAWERRSGQNRDYFGKMLDAYVCNDENWALRGGPHRSDSLAA